MVNAWLVYQMIIGDLSIAGHILQMAACSAMIPLIYMAFAAQVKLRAKGTTIILWVIALLSFIPNVLVYNPFLPLEYPSTPLHPFALYVISHGEKVFAIYMGDLMVMLQVVWCTIKFIPFVIRLRRLEVYLSLKTYAFLVWVVLSAIATIMLSSMNYEALQSPSGQAIYFITYSIMIVTFNVLILLRFDFDLLESSEGEVVEDINEYLLKRYEEMALALKAIVEGEEMYLKADCTAEYMVDRLKTNRTYLSQMLASQFGMTFNEYITSLRMTYIEKMLTTTNLPISEITTKSGFNDSGYMARKFREKNGVSPSVWRAKNKTKSVR